MVHQLEIKTREKDDTLLPTPPIPEHLRGRQVPLTENSRKVLERRYLRKGPDGKPVETILEMFWRVAWHVAEAEDLLEGDRWRWAETFFDMLTRLEFLPNSPTFTGAGTPLGQLAACFVLPIEDDMGKVRGGIFDTLRNAALIQQTGGGNGFSFSRLRPLGEHVLSSAGKATGPVGFLRVYDKAFGEIAQGGCLLPDTLVFTERGLLRLDEIVDPERPGWQPHTLRVATDEGWRSSPRGYNNGLAPVLRVHTREGISLTGTPEHRVKVMTDNGPEWRQLQELRPGDWLIVRLGEHRGRLQALRHPQPRHGNQIWPKLPSILDEELAFFLGYLAGDGFIATKASDHRIGVSVAHTSYLMEEMPALMERLFGVNVHRWQKPGDRSVTFVIDNRAVKEFLLLNGFDKPDSRSVCVPRLIRQSPPEVVGAYLRGLFEADGALSHGYPTLMTTSKRLAKEVATLLMGLGCPVRIRTIAPGVDRWGDSETYQVRIHSTVGLKAWRERIGCDMRSRFVAAFAWESDQRRESSYVLPCPRYWLDPVLEAITLEQIDAKGRGRGIKFRSTTPALRRTLLRYVRGERNFTRSAYDELCRRFPEFAEHARSPEGLWFVQVTGVEPAGEALTLDLEVDENHTYLAYGIVTHNTRRGANMAVLRVDHPDIREFIRCKEKEGEIANFNISVAVTDDFMRAVENDEMWPLRFPDVHHPRYRDFRGTINQAEKAGIPINVYEHVRARELFDEIVRHAHHNGEPGVLFIDRANRDNPVPHLYELEATNPCFVGSTRIATDKGLIPIRELAERGEPFEVVTDNRAPWRGQGDLRPELGTTLRPAVKAWKTRTNVPVLRLRTRKGYTIVATPDHRFLTPDRGYVELQHLRPGDKVLLQSGEGAWSQEYLLPNMEVFAEVMSNMALAGDRASGHVQQRRDFVAQYSGLPREWSSDLGLVLGWLVGDGWLSPTSKSPVGMVFRSPEVLARIHGILRKWFGEGHLADRGSHYQLTYGRLPYEFFTSLGVLPVKATEKRVPESIWMAPREAVVGFLQGLFSADGSVQVNEKKNVCTVRLASSSCGLLEDVQLLLLNFGIVSCIYHRRDSQDRLLPDGRGGVQRYSTAPQYELVIGKANRDRFAHLIGFADPEKQSRLMAYVESLSRGPYRETFVDEVVEIKDAGTADVYDLMEPETHSLIANGLVCHNCGEQWLGPYENCCLGSVNLAKHLVWEEGRARLDWEKLARTVHTATRFLDDVVTANKYVPAVPELREAAERARRIGLGIMGLADVLYALRVRYGSPEGQELAAQIMEWVRYHAMLASIELAQERGPFPAIDGSIYDPANLTWEPPTPLEPYTHDWGRPPVEWDRVVQGIRQHGIRNAAQTTIAPTGTLSTVSGVEGYGCEPVFALSYIRHVHEGDQVLDLYYFSPLFEQALTHEGIDAETRQRIKEKVALTGSCQDVPEVPEDLRHVFVVAQDITPEEHVYMQAALQRFTDNAISKTVNFPEHATVDDVAKAYFLAWKLGCKGITVYVTGSREQVVLETKKTLLQKQQPRKVMVATQPKARPRRLQGATYFIHTPLGKAYVTVNREPDGEPFEVFANVGKAGSDIAAVSEAIGRLISLILRLPSPMTPTQRLEEVVDQLSGIGGGRHLGFGAKRILSLPDALAQVLREDLLAHADQNGQRPVESLPPEPSPVQPELFEGVLKADLCPDCGHASLVNEEGCRKCYSCGYSEC